MTAPATPNTYESAGVSVAAGERFVERIKSISRRGGQNKLINAAGGYAAVYEITPERYIALTTDGVGTKVLLAHQNNAHHGIGIDLVAMCANDLVCVGARPTLFLDYFATGKLDVETGVALIEGILDGCDQAGMILVGGETAEMPDVYHESQYDLAGFAVGEVTPQTLLTGQTIQPGQKVIGVASSGIHSNGLSLARKVLTGPNATEQLLTPTVIYVKPVLAAMSAYPDAITGMAHITGGGWRNLFRLKSEVGFDIQTPLPLLPVFESILAQGVAQLEAYKTFNMGMGLALIVQSDAEAIVSQFTQAGLNARIVGEVTDKAGHITLHEKDLMITA